MKYIHLLTATLALLIARGAEAQTFCVFDPMGTAGDYFSLFKDYQVEAKRWGVNMDLQAYTDDNKLIQGFESGSCDMASMIGFRARKYNQMTGTIDAPSTIENYSEMRDLLAVLSSERMAPYMVSGPYEVVGVLPVGAGYAVCNDKSIHGIAGAVGKRVAIPNFDKSLVVVVNGLKAVPVPVDLMSYGTVFAQGKADCLMIPLVLYKPLEIDKALEKNGGGIVRRPLHQLTMQIIAHKDHFPAGFGEKSRAYMVPMASHALGIARNLDNQVDPKFWIFATHADFDLWNSTMHNIGNEMVKQGYLNKKMVNLLRHIRCKGTPEEAECKELNAAGATDSGTAIH